MGGQARILVVDDDESIRKVLKAVLEDNGYTVNTAEDAQTAVRKSRGEFFNLALIDIRLPDMEGTALLARLRDTTPRMRKIIITGYPSLQNAMEALNKGADAYMLKPFDMDALLRTVGEQLKEQTGEKEYNQDKVTEFIRTRVKELGIAKET